MKLYASIENEKGRQVSKGGNEYLDIDIRVGNQVLMALTVKENEDGYYVVVGSDDIELQHGRGIPVKKEVICEWCNKRKATHKDWREIDGMTTSTRECDTCSKIETDELLKGKTQKG